MQSETAGVIGVSLLATTALAFGAYQLRLMTKRRRLLGGKKRAEKDEEAKMKIGL